MNDQPRPAVPEPVLTRDEKQALERIWRKAEAMRGKVVYVGVKEKPCQK